eukprot:363801-Chlamydomonas_euryale.AAC.16
MHASCAPARGQLTDCHDQVAALQALAAQCLLHLVCGERSSSVEGGVRSIETRTMLVHTFGPAPYPASQTRSLRFSASSLTRSLVRCAVCGEDFPLEDLPREEKLSAIARKPDAPPATAPPALPREGGALPWREFEYEDLEVELELVFPMVCRGLSVGDAGNRSSRHFLSSSASLQVHAAQPAVWRWGEDVRVCRGSQHRSPWRPYACSCTIIVLFYLDVSKPQDSYIGP